MCSRWLVSSAIDSNERPWWLISCCRMNPCTIQCRLAQGQVPQLQCVKCLCLYHNECVERRGANAATAADGQGYTCDVRTRIDSLGVAGFG